MGNDQETLHMRKGQLSMSMHIFRRLSWGLMEIIAIGVAIYFATPYLLFNPALSRLRLNPSVSLHFPILAIHAGIAGAALLIGPFQFLTPLRAKYPSVHRLIGRIYIVCVFIASIAAFFSALFSVSGFVAQVGFLTLDVLWFYSICQAYVAIRRGQIPVHRVWMTRNYALTFGAVMLRAWLYGGIALTILTHSASKTSQSDIYAASAWISWVFTLAIAEWVFNQRLLQTFFVKPERVSDRAIASK